MKNKKIYIPIIHIIFWLVTLLRYVIIVKDINRLIIIEIGIIASLCYLNYFVLVPVFLKKNKPSYYVLWAFIFTTLFTICYSSWWYYDLTIEEPNSPFPLSTAITVSYLISVYYGAVSTFARLVIDWKINLAKNRDLLIQKTNAQIQLMKSNINIPFMLQSLTFAEAQAIQNPKNAIQPILQLSSILRYGLYDSQSERIELAREVEALNDYVTLHNQIEPNTPINLETKSLNENKFIIPNLLVKATINWKTYIQNHLEGNQTIQLISDDNVTQIKFPVSIKPDDSDLKAIFPEIINENYFIKRESDNHSISLLFYTLKK